MAKINRSSCCKGARLSQAHSPYCYITRQESSAKLRAIADEKNRVARAQEAQKVL